MQLKTGFYYISTIVTSPWGERWVQRDTVEDKSMLTKPVNVQVNEAGAAEVNTSYVARLQTPTSFHRKHKPLTCPSLRPVVRRAG